MHWAPHSMMWPATTAPASSSQSVRAQPECHAAGADHDGGVGDPAGDDDVGPAVEAFDDAPAAEVGVGGQRHDAELVELLAGVEVGEVDAGGAQLVEAGQQVVALDVGDRAATARAGRRAPRWPRRSRPG